MRDNTLTCHILLLGGYSGDLAASGPWNTAVGMWYRLGTLDAQERSLIAQGKKIEAIKHHRDRTGSSLKEAHDAVERGDA